MRYSQENNTKSSFTQLDTKRMCCNINVKRTEGKAELKTSNIFLVSYIILKWSLRLQDAASVTDTLLIRMMLDVFGEMFFVFVIFR